MPQLQFLYTLNYYRQVGQASERCANEMLPFVVNLISPRSFLELGSGTGSWTRAAARQGIEDYIAVDGNWVQESELVIPKEHFVRHELNMPLDLGRKFDLAISLEVAEHLKESSADQFVETLTSHSDIILFGAATPMQGGTGHINEQWPTYWIDKFERVDYHCFDIIRPKFWGNEFILPYYIQNTFIFIRRDSNVDLAEILHKLHSDLYADTERMMFIHPRQYIGIASMETISARLIMRQTPKIFWRRIRARFGWN